MSEPSRSVERVAGCEIGIWRSGSGEPLLFLHGARGAGQWLPFMATLARHFDVIVPEHPGFGRSGTPDWLDNVGDLAYFYLDFIRQKGLSGVNLVGASLGGWIAAEVAVRNSTTLKSLTLSAAAGIHVPGPAHNDYFLWSPEDGIRNSFVDQSIAERMLDIPLTQVEDMLKNQITTARLAWEPRFHNPHLAKWLHRIDIPTLILWGDSDKIFPMRQAQAYQELIPHAQLKIIQDCGHVPQVEKTDAFVDAIVEFTGGIKS